MLRSAVAGSAVATLSAAVLLPGSAVAGTAVVDTTVEGRADQEVVFVRYTGAPGEANRITARFTRADDGTGAATLTDAAGATPGAGCVRPNPGDAMTVRCQLGGATTFAAANAFAFDLGDGDDRAEIVASPTTSGDFVGGPGDDTLRAGGGSGGDPEDPGLPSGATFTAGPGDDTMIGGPGEDFFFEGGPEPTGADEMRGGRGVDSLGYAGRLVGVSADLAGDRDDGAPRERDLISGVENLAGGDGADRLVGSGEDNRLIGNGGRDVLVGGRGNDSLTAGADNIAPGKESTADRLSGGPGNDLLIGNAGANRINPGAGEDDVSAGARSDTIAARDGRADNVGCGVDADRVDADSFDFVALRCEMVRRRGAPRAALTSDALLLGSVNRPYVNVTIGCPVDFDASRCSFRATVGRRGTVLGALKAGVRRGRSREAFIYFNRAGSRFVRRLGLHTANVRITMATRAGRETRSVGFTRSIFGFGE